MFVFEGFVFAALNPIFLFFISLLSLFVASYFPNKTTHNTQNVKNEISYHKELHSEKSIFSYADFYSKQEKSHQNHSFFFHPNRTDNFQNLDYRTKTKEKKWICDNIIFQSHNHSAIILRAPPKSFIFS